MCVWQWYWENYQNKWWRFGPQLDCIGSGTHIQISFISLPWEMARGSSGGETGHHLLKRKTMQRKREKKQKSGAPGGRQGLSRLGCINPEFDSPSPTLSLPALTYAAAARTSPHVHYSHSHRCLSQIHLICLTMYLFIAIAAAASTLTEQKTPVIRHKNAAMEIWSQWWVNISAGGLVGGCMSCHVQIPDLKN